MQRWSMGHSRSRQGLHSTGSRTTRAWGPVGPVVVSSVAPKMATVGTPSAEAMCIAPESLVRKSSQAAARSMNCARAGLAGVVGHLWPLQPLRDLFAERPLAAGAEQRDGRAACCGQIAPRLRRNVREASASRFRKQRRG